MDREEIEALEPKYTGNTRHLTEGEAAAIVNDPANDAEDVGGDKVDPLSAAAAMAIADDDQSLANDNAL